MSINAATSDRTDLLRETSLKDAVKAVKTGERSTRPKANLFVQFSSAVSDYAGKPVTFALAVAGIVVWALLGPLLHYSESWQLVVNTATTIITFLMIFVLQNSQNRDAKALQVKLDELILTSTRAENCFIGAEALDEKELMRLREMLDSKLQAVEKNIEDVQENRKDTVSLKEIARSAT